MIPAIELLRTVVCDGRAPTPDARVALAPAELDWLIDSGMGALLASDAARRRFVLPDAGAAQVRAAELSARLLSDDTFVCLDELVTMAAERDIPVLLLKGVSVAQQWYPQRHWRPMRDIDILVPAAAQAQFEAGMQALGYKQKGTLPPEFFIGHQHSMPFYRDTPPCWVEVHTALFRQGSAGAQVPLFAAGALFDKSRYHAELGAHCLQPEVQLVYTAMHWACKLTPVGGLIGLMDILWMVRQADLDWERVAEYCEDPVLARNVYVALAYLQRHDLIELPAVLEPALAVGRRSITDAGMRILHGIIDRHLALGQPFQGIDSEALVNVRWETLLGSDLPMVKFLKLPWRHLFPPGGEDRYDLGRQVRRLGALWRRD